MNRNRSLGCLVAALGGLLFAGCGQPDSLDLSSSESAVQADKQAQAGVMVCDLQVPLPVDVVGQIKSVEIDRVYKSQQPGFIHEWVPVGFRANGELWGALVAKFRTVGEAQGFSDWLDNGFALNGVKFWDNPEFRLGHECHVYEVLASEERPSTEDTQVSIRIERFAASGPAIRDQLTAWFSQVRAESQRQGNSSVTLLYSEATQTASLISFDDVPQEQRSLANPIPLAAHPPFVQGSSFDWTGWNLTIMFPFQAGDQGRPAIWPMPDIEPWRGDGVCEVSRHESSQNTTDCLSTCGNGVPDPGETFDTCPGDVPL